MDMDTEYNVIVLESLRSFRRNAVHVRQAVELLHSTRGEIGVQGGYLENRDLVARYKRISIPVRRALNASDRASFAQADAELETVAERRADSREQLASVRAAWQGLQQELDSGVVLGGTRVPRRQILGAWLDAAAFYDTLERDQAYDRLIDRYGKAAEGIGSELTERAVTIILQLDELAAAALEEPLILPPPQKTPPPPPDPKEPWWRRVSSAYTAMCG